MENCWNTFHQHGQVDVCVHDRTIKIIRKEGKRVYIRRTNTSLHKDLLGLRRRGYKIGIGGTLKAQLDKRLRSKSFSFDVEFVPAKNESWGRLLTVRQEEDGLELELVTWEGPMDEMKAKEKFHKFWEENVPA